MASVPGREATDSAIEALLGEQDGVVSRAQVFACGGDSVLNSRRLRRREWRRVHSGVYVNHTGPLTWRQRAWAGLGHPCARCAAGGVSMRPPHA